MCGIEQEPLICVTHRTPRTGRQFVGAVDRAPKFPGHRAVPDILKILAVEIPELIGFLTGSRRDATYVHPAVNGKIVHVGPWLLAVVT
jgi:hypothetical protein